MTSRHARKTPPAENPAAQTETEQLEQVAAKYAVAISPHLSAKINASDPDDPIARQFLPGAAELVTTPEEDADPIGDNTHSPLPGLVHRYPDRVLLTPMHRCTVYCRFCFRREMVGPQAARMSAQELDAALDYIKNHDEIWEVILTGGDPLAMSPKSLGRLLDRLEDIPHIRVIRLHSRVPVANPDRLNDRLAAALDRKTAIYMAVHCNHPRELDETVIAGLERLHRAGVVLLSQTVLLKGVNDDADTLETLFRKLTAARIRPYYLHQGDFAPGTAQFRTSVRDGQAIMRTLRGRLSGIAQPLYVLDIPGGYGKIPVGPGYIRQWGDDGNPSVVTDYRGFLRPYPGTRR